MKSEYSYVYIAMCNDRSLYTGYTTDLKRREEEHNHSEKGAKYTRGRRPVEIVYFEKFKSSVDAKVREAEIKKLTRAQKLKLIKEKTTI